LKPRKIRLELSEDEVEMLVDALEVDLDGYVEAAKEARGNNRRAEVETFSQAAARISALIEKLRPLIGSELSD
jgi:hypothetical protein